MSHHRPITIVGAVLISISLMGLIGWAQTESTPALAQSQDVEVWVGRGEFFDEIFRDPWEIALFMFEDGHYFTITTMEEARIGCPIGMVMSQIRIDDRTPAELLFVVHTHRRPRGFSYTDKRFYGRLVSEGFVGRFGIYYPASGKIKWMEGNQ